MVTSLGLDVCKGRPLDLGPTPARSARMILLIGLALLLSAGGVSSQEGNTYAVQELAPGVYAAVRHVVAGPADCNVLIIVNEFDVVVVDANFYPSSARAMVNEIRRLTSNPVRYVINTHYHSDHVLGDEAYRQAFPGVEIIAHPLSRALMIDEMLPNLPRNIAVDFPNEISRIQEQLDAGKGSNGEPLGAEERAELGTTQAAFQFWIRDMQSVQPVPATLTVADSLVLHRGERTIEVKHLGLGNTPGDLVVYLPKERIVATGDLVVHPIPFAYSSFPREWPATLRALRALDAVKIVPGHGGVQSDWMYVDRMIALLESTWEQVRRAVAAGADLETTRKGVDGEALRTAFGAESATMREAFEEQYLGPAIESAFRELRPVAPSQP